MSYCSKKLTILWLKKNEGWWRSRLFFGDLRTRLSSYPYRQRGGFVLRGAGGRRGAVWTDGPRGVRGSEREERPLLHLAVWERDLRQAWRSPQHGQGHIGARCKQTHTQIGYLYRETNNCTVLFTWNVNNYSKMIKVKATGYLHFISFTTSTWFECVTNVPLTCRKKQTNTKLIKFIMILNTKSNIASYFVYFCTSNKNSAENAFYLACLWVLHDQTTFPIILCDSMINIYTHTDKA